MLVDQIVREANILAECPRHPLTWFNPHSRLDTLNKVDYYLMSAPEDIIESWGRSQVQIKGLMLLVLRSYPRKCPRCP